MTDNTADREQESSRPNVVHVNISGPVIGSEIYAAGRDIVLERYQPRIESSNRVLLASADWELLNLSISGPAKVEVSKLSDVLYREFRLLLVALPTDGHIVLPPTYYCESPLAREIVAAHLPAVEQGYIKLITEYIDLREYFERKKQRYAKASHFTHYRDAYYQPDYTPVDELPFQKSPKATSIGRNALHQWTTSITSLPGISFPQCALDELRNRVLDTEQPAFLWENVAEHIESLGISPSSPGAQQLRALKNRCYLTAYMLGGVAVPCGSALISDLVVPSFASKHFNLRAWEQFLALAGVLDQIYAMPIGKLLSVKLRPEFAIVIAEARNRIARGRPVDSIVAWLFRSGKLKTFAAALKC